MYSKAYSNYDNGGLKISGTNSEYLISPEIWTFLNKNQSFNCFLLALKFLIFSF